MSEVLQDVTPVTTETCDESQPENVVYNEQQINDYCEKVLSLCLVARTEGSLMFESVQIIKQLKGQLDEAGERLEDEGLRR